MKTSDIIKNSYILSQDNCDTTILSGIMRSPERIAKTIKMIASYYFTSRSRNLKVFTESGTNLTVDDALESCSNFTKGLNKRFGAQDFIILNTDDIGFTESFAMTPPEFIWKNIGDAQIIENKLKDISKKSLSEYIEVAYLNVKNKASNNSAKIAAMEAGKAMPGSEKIVDSKLKILNVIKNSKLPHAITTINVNNKDPRLSIIDIADSSKASVSESLDLFFAINNNEYNRTFIFMHELGHSVNPLTELRDFSDNFLDERSEFNRHWSEECFADCYSAALNAKTTGNWDILRSTILPFRAYCYNAHNTYHIVEKLLNEDPRQFDKIPDSRLWAHVNQIVINIMKSSISEKELRIADDASDFMSAVLCGLPANIDDFDQDVISTINSRVQVIIDAIFINMVSSSKASEESIGGISMVLRSIKQESLADKFESIIALDVEDQIKFISKYCSESAFAIASRQASNESKISELMLNIENDGISGAKVKKDKTYDISSYEPCP